MAFILWVTNDIPIYEMTNLQKTANFQPPKSILHLNSHFQEHFKVKMGCQLFLVFAQFYWQNVVLPKMPIL